MSSLKHPSALNAFQQYRQACHILRNTSRATNLAWYQRATDLDFQLHIRHDGQQIACFYFDRKQDRWSDGPSWKPEFLQDRAKLDAAIHGIVHETHQGSANSLGVILHVADEFATTELKPELDNPASLPDLRDTAVSDPGSILEDASIPPAQASWRVVPYPAAGAASIGTTVMLSRQCDGLLAKFREEGAKINFPVITLALSAPLVATMGLNQCARPNPGKPFVAILQYPWFTSLAFFNEHADLRLLRTLRHRGLLRPTKFRHALATTCASLEFIDPDLFVLPLGPQVDAQLVDDLKTTFTASRVERIEPVHIPNLPLWCPEPAICLSLSDVEEPTIASQTFVTLRDERWALQDFLPTPRELAEVYPNQSEMHMLKLFRLCRIGLFLVTLLCGAYFLFEMATIVRRTEWAFDPAQSAATKTRLATLTSERQLAEHWHNLLADRSKAWVAMEAFVRLFPANKGVLVRNYSHTVKPDPALGQPKSGFVREWKITGFARDEAVEYLNNLNTRDGISAHFSEVAAATGNASYSPAMGNRSISVNVRTQENNTYKPVPPEETVISDESSYPLTFDLTITQRFESTDPLAINVTKPR